MLRDWHREGIALASVRGLILASQKVITVRPQLRCCFLFLSAVIVFMDTSLACGRTFSYPEDGFAITLPDEWIEIPSEILGQKAREVQALAPNARVPNWTHAYQIATASDWFEYPYMTIIINKNGRLSEYEIETLALSASGEQSVKRDTSHLITNIEFGKYNYDPSNRIVWMASISEIATIGSLVNLMGLVHTQQGYFAIWGYSLAESFSDYEEVFRSAVKSVAIDDTIKYKTYWLDRTPLIRMVYGKINPKYLAVFLVIGAFSLLLRVINWNKTRRAKSFGRIGAEVPTGAGLNSEIASRQTAEEEHIGEARTWWEGMVRDWWAMLKKYNINRNDPLIRWFRWYGGALIMYLVTSMVYATFFDIHERTFYYIGMGIFIAAIAGKQQEDKKIKEAEKARKEKERVTKE